ncbi:MAG: PHP domain-containing protein [Candidatus Omnitrophica bacterium]|nr:PHP domain-containing protein [Candidatus Omnitrophota bacterium]
MISYDLHTHTKYSDGRATVLEMVFAAEALGLSHIAITDHYTDKNNTWVGKVSEEIEEIRGKFSVKILKGAEGAVLNEEGGISVDKKIRDKLDLLLVHMGGEAKGIAKETDKLSKEDIIENITTAYTKAAENPLVDIIAHPFNIGYYFDIVVEPREYPIGNLKRIAEVFVKNNTCFEIMNNIWWWFPGIHPREFTRQYIELVRVFAKVGVKFSLGSNAHSVGGVGNLIWSKYVIEKTKIENQLIEPDIFVK